jgi:polyhydroxyalkanoate synthesis regulator protein
MSEARKPDAILIRRYGRSRLYDAENQRYVSIEQLQDLAAKGISIAVLDTETGADVTRVLLA